MKRIIQFHISRGDAYYIAEGVDLSIVTQGKTLDKLMQNIQEAVELHLEGENPASFGLEKDPSVLVNIELSLAHV
jgi:predicted RNase H-like HicB family nuclease